VAWWFWFLLDVTACLFTSAIAGGIFGVHAYVEDVRYAWRRPVRQWRRVR
jgi:hypothetical protein